MDFLNKVANSVTNKTSLLVGRENLANFTNSINRTFKKSKYRDFIKHGNTVQLIARSSKMSLQICSSPNDQSRLILYGNGQIGPDYRNSHYTLELTKRNNHVQFKNLTNYIAFDNEIPCVLPEVLQPKNSKEAIRARNEFRVHEVLGSDEYFSLESVYYPGRYISVLPDGAITVTRNKSDDTTHFCLNIIHVMPQYIKQDGSQTPVQTTPAFVPTPHNAEPVIETSGASSGSLDTYSVNSNNQEAERKLQETVHQKEEPAEQKPADAPPEYTNLFPKLPGQ
jgi:hypothetical protein